MSIAWTLTRKSYIQLGIRQKTSLPLPPQTISSCCKTKSNLFVLFFSDDQVESVLNFFTLKMASHSKKKIHTPTTYNFQQNTRYFDKKKVTAKKKKGFSSSTLTFKKKIKTRCAPNFTIYRSRENGCAYSKPFCVFISLSSMP